jgi:prefoldin alpha subunit
MNKNDLLLRFSYLREQEEALTKNISLLEEKLREMIIAKHTLEELQKEGQGEILMPIGGGCFVKAELKALDRIIINIGDGVSKEASVEESLSKLDEHADNIRKTIIQVRESLKKVEENIAVLNEEIRKQT